MKFCCVIGGCVIGVVVGVQLVSSISVPGSIGRLAYNVACGPNSTPVPMAQNQVSKFKTALAGISSDFSAEFLTELLVVTPPQDYDDSYVIKYAQSKDGCILTNDMYRDYVEKCHHKRRAKDWLRSHLISFTFVGDEFLPNPDFEFPPPWTGGEVK